jgi:hypothetical protein
MEIYNVFRKRFWQKSQNPKIKKEKVKKRKRETEGGGKMKDEREREILEPHHLFLPGDGGRNEG